jgi:hypothetical protein
MIRIDFHLLIVGIVFLLSIVPILIFAHIPPRWPLVALWMFLQFPLATRCFDGWKSRHPMASYLVVNEVLICMLAAIGWVISHALHR